MSTILTVNEVKKIKRMHFRRGMSTRLIAKYFGIGKSTVGDIVSGDTWKNIQISDIRNVEVTPKMIEQFASRYVIDKKTGCWNWQNNNANVIFCINRIGYKAAQVSLLIYRDLTPQKNDCATHTCGNPLCVNPYHLKYENAGDLVRQVYRAKTNYQSKCINPEFTRKRDATLTMDQVQKIRDMYATKQYSYTDLSIIFSVSRITIRNLTQNYVLNIK